MPRCMNFCIDDVVAGAAKEAHQPCKKILLVPRIDHDLQAFGIGVDAHLDHWFFVVRPVVKTTGVPGNFLGRMAQEVHRIELFPQAFVYGC